MSRPLLSSALLGPEAWREECGLCPRRCSYFTHGVCEMGSGRGVCCTLHYLRETDLYQTSGRFYPLFRALPPSMFRRNPALHRNAYFKARAKGVGCMHFSSLV